MLPTFEDGAGVGAKMIDVGQQDDLDETSACNSIADNIGETTRIGISPICKP
jgi:hypothetical protein